MLVAVGVSEFIAFSWWQLGLVIAVALFIGTVLRLGDERIEVPVSAMLIFATAGSAGSHTAAAGRVVDTLVGTAAGLAGGLVFAPPRVKPAREAFGSLTGQLADLLGQMAGDRSGPGGGEGDADGQQPPGPDRARVSEWLTQARALRDQVERVDDTLRTAADSVRLNPRGRLGPGQLRPAPTGLLVTEVALRGGLETLEHAAVTLRVLARSMFDSAGSDSERSPLRDERTRVRLAVVLGNLAEAMRTYGRLVQAFPSGSEALESELAAQLEAARRAQDDLAARPRAAGPAEGGSSEWPLRGELLTHVDRLRTVLRPDAVVRPDVSRKLPRSPMRAVRRPAGQRGRVKREKAERERAQRDRAKRERGHRTGPQRQLGGQPTREPSSAQRDR